MSGILIDTDVAIDFLRGMEYAQPLLTGLWAGGNAVLSVLTIYELTADMRESEKVSTQNFIEACLIEQVTAEIAQKGGVLYGRYRANGITLTSLDCLIAATALVKGYKIATRNVNHYPEKGIVLPVNYLV
jgi:predicted nucleic acid-binding protein